MGQKNTVVAFFLSMIFLIFESPASAQNVSLEKTGDPFSEEGGSATIIARTDFVDNANDITVNLDFSGDAIAAVDYSPGANSITIPAGNETGSIDLTGLPDNIYEGNEILTATINSVSGGTASIGDPSSVSLEITDQEDLPEVTISASPLSFNEDVGTVELTVALSNPSVQTITLDLGVTGGTAEAEDYDFDSNQVSFSSESISEIVPIDINDDVIYELSETLTIDITNVIEGEINSGTTSELTLTIIDNEDSPVVNLPATTASVDEGQSIDITGFISPATYEDVTVNLSTTNGTASATDYNFTDEQVSIPAGETQFQYSIAATDDNLSEPNETLSVAITGVSGGGASQGTTTTQNIEIIDTNDTPTISMTASESAFSEDGGESIITVSVDPPSSEAISVNLGASGGTASSSDYTLSATTLSLTAQQPSQTVILTGEGDNIFEGTETLTLELSSPSGGGAIISSPGTLDFEIQDNESAPVVTLSADPLTFAEGEATTITLSMSAADTEDVTVTLGTTNGTASDDDYSFSNDPVTFTAGQVEQEFTISAVSDGISEPDETFSINITNVNGGSAYYNSPETEELTITDNNESPAISMTASTTSFSENGGESTITVSVDPPSSEAISVNLGASGGTASSSDYTLSATTLSLTAQQPSQTVTLTGEDDNIFEATETLTLELSSPSGGGAFIEPPGTLDFEITDDESVPELSLSASENSFAENESTIITASLSHPSTQDIIVTLEISNRSAESADYTVSENPVTIEAGSTSATSTITGVEDIFYEGNELLDVSIEETAGGSVDTGNNTPVTLTITDNQSPPVVSLDISPTSITENGNSTITATLDTPTHEEVTVSLATEGGATIDEDYTLSATSITIPALSTSGSVTLNAIDDDIYEGDETFNVSIQSITGGAATENGNQEITVIILDNDNAPKFTLSADPENIPEDGFTTLTVSLSNPTTENVLVNLNVNSSNADPDDYILTSTFITVPFGETEGSTTLEAIQDNLFEGDEQVTVSILGVGGGGASEQGNQKVTITIEDAQTMPTVSLEFSGTPFSENGGEASLNVLLSHASYQPVAVELDYGGTAAPTDYFGAQEQVTIPAGSLSQSLTITGIDDLEAEGEETIVVSISSVTNALEDGSQSVSATLLDDDVPGIKPTIFDSGTITSENGTQDAFTIELNTQPNSNVVIELTGLDETEGTLSIQNLTFTPDNWDQARIITVTGVDDNEVDGDITYTLTLSVVDESSDAAYHGESVTVDVTNTDNDDAGFELNITNSHTQTNESGSRDIFTVVLLSQPASDVVFAITGLDETEGNLSKSELTFTPDNWNTQQTVTITGVDDDIIDGNIDYTLTISVIDEQSDANFHGQSESLTVTNIDDDSAGIVVSATGDEISTEESGKSDSFDVMLTSQPASEVVISISGLDETEGELNVNQLTFTTSDWSQPQTVTVTGKDDFLVDGDIQYTLTLSVINTLSDDGFHDQEASIIVTNADDDIAGISITETDGQTQTTEDGGTDSFTVRLNSQPEDDVVIDISGLDSSEGMLSSTELIFSQQNWDTGQDVTITGVDDDEVDGDIDYTLTIAVIEEQSDANFHGQSESLTVTNIDNDSAGIVVSATGDELSTEESGAGDSFDVTITSQPASEVVISISGLDESEGELSISQLTFTTSDWNQPQTVTVTGKDDFLVDGDIQYTLTLSVINTLSDDDFHDQEASIIVTNADDDIAGISITETDGQTQTTEDGGTDSFTVRLNSQPQDDVIIDIRGLDSSEGSINTTQLNFSSQNWNTEQTVTITGVDDDLADGDIEYTLTLAVNSDNSDATYQNISTSLNVINTDNNEEGNEEENHAPEPENDFFEMDQYELLSGTSLIANDSDPDGDQIFIDETPLMAPENGTLTIFENGSFEYQPNSGFSGTDTFEYQVCDNQTPPLCASATVSITVNPRTMDPTGDTDNDGIPDMEEGEGDCDNDGIPDWLDPDPCYEELEIPQGFSPNGDGIGDELTIPWLNEYDRVGIIVFNRWGSVVYENNRYDNSWKGVSTSGLNKGKGLPTGTYYYVITIYDTSEQLKGYFYLAR